MKTQAYILILLMVFCGCRSNKSMSESRNETVLEASTEESASAEQINEQSTTNVEHTVVENSTTNQQTTSDSTIENESDEYKNKKTKETYYDAEGNIRAVIETEEQSGKTNKTKGQTGTTQSSNETRTDSTNTKTTQETETDFNKTADSKKESDIQRDVNTETSNASFWDNRFIQGIEWLLLPIGIAAAILFIIVIIKRKK